MTTSHKPGLTTRRTCPFCGEDFIEHDTSTDRIGTLGSIYIDGVHYIVPVKVVEFYERAKRENVRLEDRIVGYAERLENLTDAIDNFLNDTREKESIEELEQSMKDYGKQKI